MKKNNYKSIGIALSGGGHRATLFALIALLYLVDSGRNKDVTMISSVSGGSITNAFLTTLPTPFNKISIEEFEPEVAKFAQQIAGSKKWESFSIWSYIALMITWIVYTFGNLSMSVFTLELLYLLIPLFFAARFSGMKVVSILIALIICANGIYPTSIMTFEQAYFFIPLLLWATLIGPRSGGTLFNWWGTWLYLGLLGPLVVITFALWWHEVPTIWWQWPCLLLIIGCSLYFRYKIAEYAYDTVIKKYVKRNNSIKDQKYQNAYTLDRIPSEVRHIFCSTDVRSGKHVYFTHDFVYIPYVGKGDSEGIPLRVAVEASANFPIGFPYRIFRRLSKHQFQYFNDQKKPKFFALTDGGVYDNIGFSWYSNIAELNKVGLVVGEMPDELYIVNSSSDDPADSKSIFSFFIPLIGEILQVFKLSTILYNNQGYQQAQDLRNKFIGQRNHQKVKGVVVQINHPSLGLGLRLDPELRSFAGLPAQIDDLECLEKRAKKNQILLGRKLDIESLESQYEAEKNGIEKRITLLNEALENTSKEEMVRCAKIKDDINSYENELNSLQHELDNIKTNHHFENMHKTGKDFDALVSRDVSTTLSPLGNETSLILIWHGYNTAQNNASVLLEDFPVMLPEQEKKVFASLLHGKPRRNRPKPSFF